MTGDLDPYDERSRLRISDADRHRVSELLRRAAGEGRLDIEELDERLEAAYRAKTYADLVPLTADLPFTVQGDPPGAGTRPDPSLVPATRYDTSIAIMGGVSRKGRWQVGETHLAVAVMGGIELDLREAQLSSPETTIQAYAFWGGIDIYVDAHTRVVVNGVGILGAFDQARDKVTPQLGADSPVVRINGFALMAGVTVQRKPPPGTARRHLLGH